MTHALLRLQAHALRRLARFSPRLAQRGRTAHLNRHLRLAARSIRELHDAMMLDMDEAAAFGGEAGAGSGYTDSRAVIVSAEVDELGRLELHHFYIAGRVVRADAEELGAKAIEVQRRTDTLRALIAEMQADPGFAHRYGEVN